MQAYQEFLGEILIDEQKLFENFSAFMDAIKKARPSGAKGNFIRQGWQVGSRRSRNHVHFDGRR